MLVFHVFIALKVAHSCCLIVFVIFAGIILVIACFFRSHVLEAGRRTNLSTKKRYSTSWCYIKSVILFVSKKNDGINTCDVISLKRPTMLMSYN